MASVDCSGLTFAYGATPVLKGIELAVASGELFCLLGPSGCGKTTLLRLIAGFLRPTAGGIRIAGEDVADVPTERRGLGMVFQNYALWPHLTVAGNVAFPLEVAGVPAAERAARIDEALALVSLAGFGQRRVGELSGGQQQRVSLARALVSRPRVLLLDEPLSNLDAKLRHELRGEIRRVCKAAGVTALYVTHDQAEALAVADRIALFLEGRVAQVAPPAELYRRPASRAAAAFLGEANLLPATVTAGIARCVLGEVPAPQGCVAVLVRPEELRLGESGVEAEVVAGTFQGASASWRLRLDGGEVTATEMPARLRRPGDRVRVTATDLVALPA